MTFNDDPEKFYTSASVLALAGIAWADLVRLESAGGFPARVSGAGDAVWWRAEVDAWLESRKP